MDEKNTYLNKKTICPSSLEMQLFRFATSSLGTPWTDTQVELNCLPSKPKLKQSESGPRSLKPASTVSCADVVEVKRSWERTLRRTAELVALKKYIMNDVKVVFVQD